MKRTVLGYGANALLRAIAFGYDAPQVVLSTDGTPLDRIVREFSLTFERGEPIDVTTFGDSVRKFRSGVLNVEVDMRVTQPPEFTNDPLRYTAQLPDGTFVTMDIFMESCTTAATQQDVVDWTVRGTVMNAADIVHAANVVSNVAALEAQGPPKPVPTLSAPKPPVTKPDRPARGISINGDF